MGGLGLSSEVRFYSLLECGRRLAVGEKQGWRAGLLQKLKTIPGFYFGPEWECP